MIATYISHKGKWWRVSTINRESSGMEGYGHKYAETIVWDWDVDNQTVGAIHYSDNDGYGNISTHQQVVERIYERGAFWEESE